MSFKIGDCVRLRRWRKGLVRFGYVEVIRGKYLAQINPSMAYVIAGNGVAVGYQTENICHVMMTPVGFVRYDGPLERRA